MVVLGLGAVLGAGAFAVWGPAAAAAGNWLPLAVLLAALAALCTTASTADLVVSDGRGPAGGFGDLGALDVLRAELPDGLGRLGGVAFLIARTAAVAAVAGVFGSYVLPTAPAPAAIAVIVAVTIAGVVGTRWTVRGTYALVGGTIAVLLFVAMTGLLVTGAVPVASAAGLSVDPAASGWGALGITGAAGFLSFAFAGLTRVAVVGRVAVDPDWALRRGVLVTLAIGLAVLMLLAVALLVGMGPQRLAGEMAPLAAVVDAGRAPALGVLVRVGAAMVAAAALLGVLVGLAGTVVGLARLGELPDSLAVAGCRGTWSRATLTGAAAAIVVVPAAGQAAAIAVSACAVLLAYALVNLAALRLPVDGRRWPRWLSALGIVLSLVLAASLPPIQVLVTVVLVAVGWAAATVYVAGAQ